VGAIASATWRAWYWHAHLGHTPVLTYYFQVTSHRLPPDAPGSFAHRLRIWNRVYFGSDMRADALLVGCLTAIVLVVMLPRMSSRARTRLSALAIVAMLGAALIVSKAIVTVSGWLPEWGMVAFEVCIAVLVAGLVAAPRTLLARLLTLPPLPWIGRRSYAIYLFHEIVFRYCRRSKVHLSPPLSMVFQLTVVLVVAELSFRLVEAPMLRRKVRFASPDRVTPVTHGA
jgi:peptidoglycan/LPS O-acetylase OafA/YrhL